jgi:hypothetical protein
LRCNTFFSLKIDFLERPAPLDTRKSLGLQRLFELCNILYKMLHHKPAKTRTACRTSRAKQNNRRKIKMKTKRLLALTLTMAMLLALTACGGNVTPPQTRGLKSDGTVFSYAGDDDRSNSV